MGILTVYRVVARGGSAKEIRRDSPPTDKDRVDWFVVEVARVTRGEVLGERCVSDRVGAGGVVAPLRDGVRDAGCD